MNKTPQYKFVHKTKRSVYTDLKQFCSFAAQSNKGEFMEITEWINKDGFDVHIRNSGGVVDFRLTHGEFKALKKMIKELENELEIRKTTER